MIERARLDNTRLHADIEEIRATLTRMAARKSSVDLVRRARQVDGKLALPALVSLALRADCMRVLYVATHADDRVTDQEIEALYDFLYSTARQYATSRTQYADLHPLDAERARDFLVRYGRDDGAFGHCHRATTWLGLNLCRVAERLGESEAYDRYEQMILRLCEEAARIGDVDLADARGKARVAQIHHLLAELAADGRGRDIASKPDQREAAFLGGRRVFTSTEQAVSVFEDDPFDVKAVHESARLSFERLVAQATTPAQHHDRGRMLLILGDSGAGKTHLLRAFRAHVHDRASGFCAYAQLQSRATDYARYLLAHMVESLERPYAATSPESGLFELSNGPARLLGDAFQARVAHMRESTWPDPESLAAYVNGLVDELLGHAEFARFDPDLLRALLYVQRREPRITARVVKWLRCDDMNAHDRRWLGDVVPRTGADDPVRMIQQIARLAFTTQEAVFVLMVDQAELAGFHEEASASFRRALACLQNITSEVPSAIAVIACLDNLYEASLPQLTRAAIDRLENDPPLERLASNRTYREIEDIVSTRLKWLYDAAGAVFRPSEPVFPLPPDRLRTLANRRARDVLNFCHLVQEASAAAGRVVSITWPPPTPGEAGTAELDGIAASWNDAVHGAVDLPDDESVLLELVARAAAACVEEIDGFEATVRGSRAGLEIDTALGPRRRSLFVAVANSGYQGGAFARQIEALRKAAGPERKPVLVRTLDFPHGARTDELVAAHLRRGGRKLLLPDTALRALVVFGGFPASHPPEAVARWRRRDRPIASLPAIRDLFELELGAPPTIPPPIPPTVTIEEPPAEDSPGDAEVSLPLEPETTRPYSIDPPFEPDVLLGEASAFQGGHVVSPFSMFLRHTAILGAPGSGKTTLALNVVEQLVERGASAVLVDRKGDLAGYARPGWWESIEDASQRRRAQKLAAQIDVRLFTPGNIGGRPLSFGVIPRLDGIAEHERQRVVQYATSSLASMMRLRNAAADLARRALLSQAIAVLAERGQPAGLEQLMRLIEERNDQLVSRAARYDDRLFTRLLIELETLRISEGELFDASAEALTGEVLLGRGPDGRQPFTIVSTRFLGENERVQSWVAQLLVELFRWCAAAPSTALQTILLLDEADLYTPAGTLSPPSKAPLQDLLKRGRSAGLGVLLASQSPADFDYRIRDVVTSWIVGKIGDKRSIEKMQPLFERRPHVAGKLAQLSAGHFWFLQESTVQEIRREPSLLRTDQLPDTEILALARAQRSR